MTSVSCKQHLEIVSEMYHGVQPRMILVVIFFSFFF